MPSFNFFAMNMALVADMALNLQRSLLRFRCFLGIVLRGIMYMYVVLELFYKRGNVIYKKDTYDIE